MAVKRIVTNIATADPRAAHAFYGDVLGLAPVMDHGWILTFPGPDASAPQVSFAVEGGSGTAVPDLSIEVDDIDEVHRRAVDAGFDVEYGPATEPSGVRRFFVRDPFGRLLNILSHGSGIA